MIQSTAEPKKIGGLEGALLIVAVAAGLWAVSILAELSARLLKLEYASIAVWLAGVLLAMAVMRRYLRGFRYTLDHDILYVERLFGQQSRLMFQISGGDFLHLMAKDQLPADSRVFERAFCSRNASPIFFLSYRHEDSIRCMAFQPDEKLKCAIENSIASRSGEGQ